MLNLRETNLSSEELFARNYERLLSWSLHVTGGDRSVAEDLLHDVYILFSIHQPDLQTIDNLEGYLYTMLRNLHISRLRRATRAPLRQLSIIEFDSAETGLRTLSAYDHLAVQDELRTVCRYACARKEKAKSACALILRFFHGYYPSEVARVLKTSRPAVDVRLLHARNEARLVLENPRALGFVEGQAVAAAVPTNFVRPVDDLLGELRETIFQSRRGVCLTRGQLKEHYQPGDETPPGQEHLAHLVSCHDCLDEVNRRLGIPPLSERHPADTITRESRGGGSGNGAAKVGVVEASAVAAGSRRVS